MLRRRRPRHLCTAPPGRCRSPAGWCPQQEARRPGRSPPGHRRATPPLAEYRSRTRRWRGCKSAHGGAVTGERVQQALGSGGRGGAIWRRRLGRQLAATAVHMHRTAAPLLSALWLSEPVFSPFHSLARQSCQTASPCCCCLEQQPRPSARLAAAGAVYGCQEATLLRAWQEAVREAAAKA